MSQYTIERSCGHIETMQICGTNRNGERERRAEYEATRMCRECYLKDMAAKRSAANAQAADANKSAGAPMLIGSDKQIAWAESLRAPVLALIADLSAKAIAARGCLPAMYYACQDDIIAYMQQINMQASAKWWIDNRTSLPRSAHDILSQSGLSVEYYIYAA